MSGRLFSKKTKPVPPPAVQYLPALSAFLHATVDIYTGNGAYPIPGPKRTSAASCLISGTWFAGHRVAVASTDKHSHIMLLDPQIEVRDPYAGNGQPTGQNADACVIKGANLTTTVSPWLFVVFSFVTFIPGLGRKKVVLLDQISTFPARIMLKDSFIDANGTLLTAHLMDVGSGWIGSSGLSIQNNQCVGTGNVYSNAGLGDFSSASIVIPQVRISGQESGFLFRRSDANNYLQCRLSTSLLDIQKTVAGVTTTVGNVALNLTLNTQHTLNLSAIGATLTCNVDSSNQFTTTDSFNSTATNHGLFANAGGVSGNFSSFIINQ